MQRPSGGRALWLGAGVAALVLIVGGAMLSLAGGESSHATAVRAPSGPTSPSMTSATVTTAAPVTTTLPPPTTVAAPPETSPETTPAAASDTSPPPPSTQPSPQYVRPPATPTCTLYAGPDSNGQLHATVISYYSIGYPEEQATYTLYQSDYTEGPGSAANTFAGTIVSGPQADFTVANWVYVLRAEVVRSYGTATCSWTRQY